MLFFTSVHKLPIFFCGLLLPEDQSLALIQLNQDISQSNNVSFNLNRDKHPPYMRLYETVMPDKNIPVAENTVFELAQNMIPFKIKWGTLEETHQYVILWGENNIVLNTFHQAVLQKLSILREGHYKGHYAEYMDELTDVEQKSLLKWGSPWAEPYLPHAVIAKTKSNLVFKNLDLLWEFRQCIFTGMITGIRYEDGELIQFRQYPFGTYSPASQTM